MDTCSSLTAPQELVCVQLYDSQTTRHGQMNLEMNEYEAFTVTSVFTVFIYILMIMTYFQVTSDTEVKTSCIYYASSNPIKFKFSTALKKKYRDNFKNIYITQLLVCTGMISVTLSSSKKQADFTLPVAILCCSQSPN